MNELTCDDFLGGRVKVWQPRAGYRAATDPVLLAAATPIKSGMSCLDVGAGVGTASLCLNARVPDVKYLGIEVQADYAELSKKNAHENNMDWQVFQANLSEPPDVLKNMSFDCVISNPPFFESGTSSPLIAKDTANKLDEISLFDWIDFCLKRLKSGGCFTMINRIERLSDILVAIDGRVGATEIIPLWPRNNEPAKRMIIRAKKDAKSPLKLRAGLTIHTDGQDYTDEAQAILRDGNLL